MKKIYKFLIILFVALFIFTFSGCTRKEFTLEEKAKIAEKNGYTVIEYIEENKINELETEILTRFNTLDHSLYLPYDYVEKEVEKINIIKALLVKNDDSTQVYYAFWTEDIDSASICYAVINELTQNLSFNSGGNTGTIFENFFEFSTSEIDTLIGGSHHPFIYF